MNPEILVLLPFLPAIAAAPAPLPKPQLQQGPQGAVSQEQWEHAQHIQEQSTDVPQSLGKAPWEYVPLEIPPNAPLHIVSPAIPHQTNQDTTPKETDTVPPSKTTHEVVTPQESATKGSFVQGAPLYLDNHSEKVQSRITVGLVVLCIIFLICGIIAAIFALKHGYNPCRRNRHKVSHQKWIREGKNLENRYGHHSTTYYRGVTSAKYAPVTTECGGYFGGSGDSGVRLDNYSNSLIYPYHLTPGHLISKNQSEKTYSY
ncbi:hypothetical protein MMC20_006130 [Loxospora ochrophaea]|nr:hypothetical protein [Loxospora ochrophaea]